MKKVIAGLILMVASALLPASAFAAGGVSVSTAALTIEVGEAGTFTIAATNAIGDVMITSSDAGVARVSASEWGTGMVEEGQTKTGVITVTGVSEGTATIALVLDVATFDGEDLAGQTRTVTVNVVGKPEAPAVVEDNSSVRDVGVGNSVVNNATSNVSDRNGGEQDGPEGGDAEEGNDGEEKNAEKENSVVKQSSSQSNKSRSSDKENESSKASGGVWWIVAVAVVGVVILGAAVWVFVKKKGRR